MTETSTNSDPLDLREALNETLSLVANTTTFAVGGFANNFPLSNLSVAGVGQIPLPLQPGTATAIHEVSEQAPFGKGADTVVDTSVRNCRQVDAKHVIVGDPWKKAVQSLAVESASTLGVSSVNVIPSLYKLILYPAGGFFTSHKDTEKEKGMLATLVIQLPSKYTGGSLAVRHRGEEKRFDFTAQSESCFYSAAFYADCEHELLPVTDGYRLCLIYNLLRLDGGPLPSVKQHDEVLDGLIAAAKVWEEQGEPNQLAVPLEHQYTNANLAFRNLKGRDAAISSVLQRSRQFELHLALVERHVSGAAAYDGYRGSTQRYGDWGDNEGQSGAHYGMDDILEDSVDVLKWVSQNDQIANLGSLSVRDEDMLGDEALFDEDDTPNKEEFESYTGNAGPTVDYWYYRAVLVIWLRSKSVIMACSGSFASAVQLAMRSVQEGAQDALQIAKQVVSYAEKCPDKAQGRLAGLMEVACAVKHLGLIRQVLQLMSRAVVRESRSCSYQPTPVVSGCCSAKHASSVLTAIKMFGWKKLGPSVLGSVKATPNTHIGFCASLACGMLGSPETSEGAEAVAKEVCKIMLEAKLEDAAAPSCAKMLLLIKSCSEQKATFLKRATELGAGTLAETLKTIHASCQSTSEQDFIPEFTQLFTAYISKAINTRDATQATKHIASIWILLLGPKPRNDELLDTFCKTVIGTKSRAILRELLKTAKSKSMIGDPFVTRIATALVSQLKYAKPQHSKCQRQAYVPNHRRVTEFLRSSSTSMTYSGFNGIRHARNFAAEHFYGSYNANEKHSASARAMGIGQNACVVINKTNSAYDMAVRQYEKHQAEVGKVVQCFLRLNGTPVEVTGGNEGKEKRGSSRSIIDLTVDSD